jgi:hypothetical protein
MPPHPPSAWYPVCGGTPCVPHVRPVQDVYDFLVAILMPGVKPQYLLNAEAEFKGGETARVGVGCSGA